MLLALRSRYEHVTLTAASLASAETFGTASLRLAVAAASITSSEAFGGTTIRARYGAASITSSEALGAAVLRASYSPASIASSEQVAAARLRATYTATSIGSAESFGVASIDDFIRPQSIASGETFGVAVMLIPLTLAAAPVESVEAFGVPTIAVHTPVDDHHWRSVQNDLWPEIYRRRLMERSQKRRRRELIGVGKVLV